MKALGIETSSYGSLLIPMLTSKLPTDLCTLFARKFNVWLLGELLVIVKNELEAKERSVSPGDKHFERSEFSRCSSTTASLHTGSEFIKGNCVFCSGNNHNSNRSAKVKGLSARKQIIFQKNLCHICMSPKHEVSKCNANYICKKYNGRHHISICQKGNLKSTGGNNSGAGNYSTNVQPTLPNQNHQSVINPANKEVINLDNRNSEKCDILFDSGAQRTYITKSLKDKLNFCLFDMKKLVLKFLEQQIQKYKKYKL